MDFWTINTTDFLPTSNCNPMIWLKIYSESGGLLAQFLLLGLSATLFRVGKVPKLIPFRNHTNWLANCLILISLLHIGHSLATVHNDYKILLLLYPFILYKIVWWFIHKSKFRAQQAATSAKNKHEFSARTQWEEEKRALIEQNDKLIARNISELSTIWNQST